LKKEHEPVTEQPKQPISIEEATKLVKKCIAGEIRPISLSRSPEHSNGSGQDLAAGRVRYLTKFESDARQAALKLQFLKACRELGIEESRWPKWESVSVLSGHDVTIQAPPDFKMRAFDVRRDTAEGYLKSALCSFREHARKYAKDCNKQREQAVESGFLVPVAQPRKQKRVESLNDRTSRETTTKADHSRRMQWAVLRYCSNMPYWEIWKPSSGHNPGKCERGQIRTAVSRILKELDLTPQR
jgi:hypothetical protein